MAEISSEENDYKAKELAFYEATINAWITTKFEKDKHLLSLSLAAIGLLITLLTTVGAQTICQALIYGAAIAFFLISVISVLFIFDRNSTHLQKMLKEGEVSDPVLRFLDKSAGINFFIGIVFTFFLGVNVTVTKLTEEKKEMDKIQTIKRMIEENTESFKKSVDGISIMRPVKPESPKEIPSNPKNGGDNNQANQNKQDKK